MNRWKSLGWLCLMLSPLPLLVDYFGLMWKLEEYRFFPLLGFAIVFLVMQSWDRVARLPGLGGAILIGGGIAAVLLAAIRWSPWLGCVGFVLIVGSWLISHTGEGHRLAPIWCLAWLFVRPPMSLDLQLTTFLQRKTVSLASIALDWLAVPHFRTGNVFELQGGPLFVEEACSGVQSLFALLFIATFLVVWLRRPLISLPVYWMSAVVWAVTMNLVRIVAIAWAQDRYGVDLAHGWQHAVVGYLALFLAFLLLLSSDRLFRVILFPLPSPTTAQLPNPISIFWNRVLSLDSDRASKPSGGFVAYGNVLMPILAGVGLCMLVVQVVARPVSQLQPATASKKMIWVVPSDLLTSDTAGAKVVSFESVRNSDDETIGSNADLWKLDLGGIDARLAISQPYPEFHELSVCYSAIGWKLNDRVLVSQDSIESGWIYVKSSYMDNEGNNGLLLFAAIGRGGELVQPTDSSLSDIFNARWKYWARVPQSDDVVMVQLWMQVNGEITPDRIKLAEQVFQRCRQLVSEEIRGEN